jgi:hypothetical protein
MFAAADTNGDGSIDFNEFQALLRAQPHIVEGLKELALRIQAPSTMETVHGANA